MANITLKGNPVQTAGDLPAVGSMAPDATLTTTDLADIKISDFRGKKVILNIHPSLDTGICAAAARYFNKAVEKLDNTVAINVSMDLPFAHKRFCAAEGLDNVISTSVFRSPDFHDNYKVKILDGGMAGLNSRAVVVIDEEGKVIYAQQIPEIAQEPDYDAVLAAL